MSQKRFINRDISWLSFNARVLQEAADPSVPLIERMRFLGIFSNNLDEFFRVRYASVKRMGVLGSSAKEELGGISPAKLLQRINEIVMDQQRTAQKIYEELITDLEKHEVVVVKETGLTPSQELFVRKFFVEKVSPAVFTLLVSDLKELPELRDKSIYLAIKMIKEGNPPEVRYSLIEIPADLVGRFIELPKYGKKYLMYLDDLIRFNLRYIFFIFDFDRIEAHTIKITRDAELDIENDVSKSFLEKISTSVMNRRVQDPVRFVYDRSMPPDLLQFLMQRMDLDNYDSLIPEGRYHNKKDYMNFPNVGGPDLEYERHEPLLHPELDLERSLLDVVRGQDVLLFLPYHTFSYFIRFLREAAIDPQVLAVQVTLYRLADQSRVISALINAAKNGKKVTVVIELQARFDEEANIRWTEKLKQEGVNVIFGVPGLKVHTKIIHITRRKESGKLEYFASVGTGNFNESTARLYTDYHLLTSDKRITKEVGQLFDFFRANYQVHAYEHLIVSPHHTRRRFMELMDREIEHARAGRPSGIQIKMNSLSDFVMIDKLYEASRVGVKCQLVMRGICSLIPGQAGVSENIEVISIIDKFLEHTRLFIFTNGGDKEFFISSADWMTRNLDFRVEVTTPVYDKKVQRQLQDHFDILWKDNVKARIIDRKGRNVYRQIPGPRIRSQFALYDYVKKQLKRGK